MDFCINAIQSQLLVNMDADIFTDFDFIPIILELFFYEGVTINHKESILQVLKVYFNKIPSNIKLSHE